MGSWKLILLGERDGSSDFVLRSEMGEETGTGIELVKKDLTRDLRFLSMPFLAGLFFMPQSMLRSGILG